MSDSQEQQKYRQLAMFTTIVAEVVVTPSVLGGGIYYLTRENSNQTLWTAVAALIGLAIGFYRIYLLNRKWAKGSND